jgi:next to BRCA1 gene 1 protein
MTASSILAAVYGLSECLSPYRLSSCRTHYIYSIVVAEPVQADEQSSDESLAASSVIMPPAPSAHSIGATTRASANISVPGTSISIPSTPPSDDGSFDSSISLINIPSSPSINDEDDEDYQDSRSRLASVATSPAILERDLEYVVLYDTSSEE